MFLNLNLSKSVIVLKLFPSNTQWEYIIFLNKGKPEILISRQCAGTNYFFSFDI